MGAVEVAWHGQRRVGRAWWSRRRSVVACVLRPPRAPAARPVLPQAVFAGCDRRVRGWRARPARGSRSASVAVEIETSLGGSIGHGDVPQAALARRSWPTTAAALPRRERRSFEYRSAKSGRRRQDPPGPEARGDSARAEDGERPSRRRPGRSGPSAARDHRSQRTERDAVTAVTDATRALARSIERRCTDGDLRGSARGRRRPGRRSVRALGRRQRPGPERLRGRRRRRTRCRSPEARLHARLLRSEEVLRRRRRVRTRGRSGVHAPRRGRVGAVAAGACAAGGDRGPGRSLARTRSRRLAAACRRWSSCSPPRRRWRSPR